MKGFETGIMLRMKNGQIEDYGCALPTDHQNDFKDIMGTITENIDVVKSYLPDDDYLTNRFNTVQDFVSNLSYFLFILSDDSD